MLLTNGSSGMTTVSCVSAASNSLSVTSLHPMCPLQQHLLSHHASTHTVLIVDDNEQAHLPHFPTKSLHFVIPLSHNSLDSIHVYIIQQKYELVTNLNMFEFGFWLVSATANSEELDTRVLQETQDRERERGRKYALFYQRIDENKTEAIMPHLVSLYTCGTLNYESENITILHEEKSLHR